MLDIDHGQRSKWMADYTVVLPQNRQTSLLTTGRFEDGVVIDLRLLDATHAFPPIATSFLSHAR